MNKIEAIFRPERLENVKTALSEVGIVGLSVTQVSGRGSQGGVEVTAARGLGTYRIDMLPKVKLEVVVNDPTPTGPWTSFAPTPSPARPATAKSSSTRLPTPSASAPANTAPTPYNTRLSARHHPRQPIRHSGPLYPSFRRKPESSRLPEMQPPHL